MSNFKVMSEQATLDACATMSIARWGDGELRISIGGGCSSQKADPKLAAELRAILAKPQPGLLPCIPNFANTPRRDVWDKYRGVNFIGLYKLPQYGSSFITRPDNAPWIDTPEYWAAVRRLWDGKDVTLVCSRKKARGEGSIELTGVKQWEWVEGPEKDAYSNIDEIQEKIGRPAHTVLLCLGTCATVLAARLARKGVHALDLGHIWYFAKHAGAYVDQSTLISKSYRKQQTDMHKRPEGYGGDGKKHAERILAYATKIGATSICDYGSGQGTLKRALVELGFTGTIAEYDPGMPGKEHLPKPAQLLACTDMLEHCEPEYLDNVLAHQFALTSKGAFMSIATRPANKVLPDGRNAHLILMPPDWWVEKLEAVGWKLVERFDKTKDGKTREIWLWLTK